MCMYGNGVTHCYMSEEGGSYATVPNEDMGLFRIERSSNSNNSTEVNRGIIMGILYSYAWISLII